MLSKSQSDAKNVYDSLKSIIDNNEYNDLYDMEDSASTIFMKLLGYDGVDVTDYKNLDNSTYGSVIYDLEKKDDINTRTKTYGKGKGNPIGTNFNG